MANCYFSKKFVFFIRFLLLIVFSLNINIVSAYANVDYNNAYFKELEIKENCITEKPIKLKDGQVLFIGKSYNYLFNPKTFDIKKFEQQIENLYVYSPVLLNNGEVLFVGAYTTLPSENFRQEIYDLIFRNTPNSYKKVQRYKKLNEQEKEAFYLPYFKDNKDFLKKYNEYKEKYDESMHSVLYNPKTNQYRKAGRVNERRRNPKTLLQPDGNVLIWGGSVHGQNSIEIFNTDTEEFTLIKNKNWHDSKNSFTNINLSINSSYIEIPENRILYCTAGSEVNIYDITNGKNENTADLSPIRNCYGSDMLLLNNNEVLIYNGSIPDYRQKGTLKSILYADGIKVQTKLQLLNLETRKLKIIKNKAPDYKMKSPLLLDDGKIIFNINSNNKYVILIPNKIVKEVMK